MIKLYYYYAKFTYYFMKIMKYIFENLPLIVNSIILLSFVILIIRNNPTKKEPEKIKIIKEGTKRTIKTLIIVNILFFTYFYILKKVRKFCGPIEYKRLIPIMKCSYITFKTYIENNLRALPDYFGVIGPVLKELAKIIATVLVAILFVTTVKNTWESSEITGQNMYG